MNTSMMGIVVFVVGNIALCAACWILSRVLSAMTDKILEDK